VPTVGTAVGHVADLAALARPAAVAIPDRDPARLATTITDLLRDRARRGTLAGAARDWAVTHDARHTATSFEVLYRRLSARSASA
jgi:hypothetical protein